MRDMLLEWVLTSTFLILAVLLVRAALGKRISAGLRYALWGVVLLRLLVPVQLFSSPVAGVWMERELHVEQTVDVVHISPPLGGGLSPLPDLSKPSGSQAVPPLIPSGAEPAMVPPGTLGPNPTEPEPVEPEPAGPVPVLLGVWLAGSALLAAVLIGSNLRFAWRLRRLRRPLEGTGCPVPVYLAEGLPSPCLFGLVRPAVYVTAQAAQDPTMLRHILAHEKTHLRHLDHIWNLLRCVSLCVHWFNPLVWLAAELSRRDGELCCDEGALRRLGDEERLSYGRTLLTLVTAKSGPGALLTCATTMTGGKKSLKERIERIAHTPKRWLWAAVAAVLMVVLACACAFGQAQPAKEPGEPEDDPLAILPPDPVDPFPEPYKNISYTDLYLSLPPNQSGTVQIEGLGNVQIECRMGSSPQIDFSGDPTFCCPRLAGQTLEGSARWSRKDRYSMLVTLFVHDEPVEFDVDLNWNTLNSTGPERERLELTDRELVSMAHVLDNLLTTAEHYVLTGSSEVQRTLLPNTPDLNRNGIPEPLYVGAHSGTNWYNPITLYFEVWEGDELLWGDVAHNVTASDLAAFLLCSLEDGDYLLEYSPTGSMGICDYTYRLFDLTGTGENPVHVVKENEVLFPCTPEILEMFKRTQGEIDTDALNAFGTEVNGLLDHSVALVDTVQNTTAGARPYELYANPIRELDQVYIQLLQERLDFEFYIPGTDEVLRFSNLTRAVTPSPDITFHVEYYTILDLDKDGETELILYLEGQGGVLILHRIADRIYCYHEVNRGFGELKTDRTHWWSGSASYHGTKIITAFTPTGTEETFITWSDPVYNAAGEFTGMLYFVDGAPATQKAYESATAAQDQKEDAPWYPWVWTEEALADAVQWLTDAGAWDENPLLSLH